MSWNINHVVWKEFKKTGKIEIIKAEPLSPLYYFNQLNYIKGTYIRKDNFQNMIERNQKKEIEQITLDLDSLPTILVDDWVKEWKRIAKEVGFLPINTSKI